MKSGTTIVPLLALASTGAMAQDVNSYQLPPAPSQTSTAQGPVVIDAPPPRVVTTPAPVPVPAPIVAPTPPLAIALPSPSALPSAPRTPPPQPSASAVTPTPSANAATAALPSASSALPAVPPPKLSAMPAPKQGVAWRWISLALIIALSALGLFGWQKRRQAKPSRPAPPPIPRKKAAPSKPKLASAPIALNLIATRMSASLVNATLSYRLILTATETIESLVLRGDMISAHASRPTEDQLGLGDAPSLHRIDQIGVGEAVELKGDIRLALAAITPINQGSSALFVPLVRIEVHGIAGGKAITLRTAFVVGINQEAANTRLRPFPLNAGPRVYAQISQRALVLPPYQ